VLEFFKSRNISQRSLKAARVSEGKEWMPQFGTQVNTIHFNYFIGGELINVKYRGPKKSFKLAKNAELVLSGIDRWMQDNEVLLCEGEIDELSYIEAGFLNVSSVPNGAGSTNLQYIDNCYKYFENKDKVYLSIDNDEAGEKLQKELIRRLGAERCYLIDLGDYKDANEALMNEGVEYLQRAVFEAKLVPIKNVKTYASLRERYRDFILNGSKPGYQIGLKSFDDVFSTYTKQHITVTGIPTHGKSDWVDQMTIGYAINYGFKTAYYSVENQPEELHIDKIIQKIYGKKPNIDDFNTPLFQKVERFVNDHFFLMNFDEDDDIIKSDLDSVLEKAAELVKRKGIRVVVLDPFNKIPLKGVDRSKDAVYTTAYLNRIERFEKRYDCIVIPVAHPVKMDNKGVMIEPNFYSIKGGGEWYDMSPHGLCVFRDFDLNLVKIKVMKCKFRNLGVNQAHVYFAWNPENGRYTEIGGDPDLGEEIIPFWNNSCWLKLKDDTDEEANEEAKQYEGFDQECGF